MRQHLVYTDLLCTVIALASAGCYSGLTELDPAGADGAEGSTDSDTSPSGGSADSGDEQPDACGGTELAPPYMRRLSVREHEATLRDLVGVSLDLSDVLPADTFIDGFDNHTSTLSVSLVHAQRYMELAATVASQVVDDPGRHAAVIGCDLGGPDRESCLRSFVERFGRRAYRRPLEPDEIDRLVAVGVEASDDPDPDAAASVILQTVLQSPNFLYRVEVGVVDPTDGGRRKLVGHEMASRLSYFLWGSTPSDELLDLAEAGDLDDASGVESAARALLVDPRAREGLEAFSSQWLRLPLLAYVQRSEATYPAWNEALRAAMAEETRRVVSDFVWGEGASVLDVLTASYTYADASLAAVYGLPAPAVDWQRIELDGDDRRGGLLTHASLLTSAASSERTAPILRGKFIRDVLLCSDVPPPPPDLPEIPEAEPGESVREQLERHRTDPACSGCHGLLDPIGFGFERYDLVGGYREVDADGNPLTGAGEILEFDPPGFVGPVELGERLREAPEVEACLARHVFRFAAGRTEVATDACVIEQLAESLSEHDANLPDTLAAFVRSDAFRFTGVVE